VYSCAPKLFPGRQGTDIQHGGRVIDAVPRTSSNATFSNGRQWDGGVECNSKRSHISVEKRLYVSFRATFGAIIQRVDLLSETLPLPLPPFAGDDSSMHAAGECTAAWAGMVK